ncbi:MAG: hypothetical protein WBE26_06755 [Phycisphaerae bacterium]
MFAPTTARFCTSVLFLFFTALAFGQGRTWTTGSDFGGGFLHNTLVVTDELRIDAGDTILPYLWVACTQRNTVVRIATDTQDPMTGRSGVQVGDVLGEYYTAPDGCRQVNTGTVGPSRTAFDFDGNVWVGNRHDISIDWVDMGHVVKLGNGLPGFDWKDRDLPENVSGQLDTSTALGDIRPWPNTGGVCENGDEDQAFDELVLLYSLVDATTVRHVTVNRRNNVWVGGTGNHTLGLIDGRTGLLLDAGRDGSPDFPFTTHTCSGQQVGGYGGVVDRDGFVWSAVGYGGPAYILRFHPMSGTSDCFSVANSYGVAVDLHNDIWTTDHGSDAVVELAYPTYIAQPVHLGPGQTRLRSVAVTPDDDVWVVSSDAHTVHRIDQSNLEKTPIDVGIGSEPTGVAVDPSGFVWVTNRATHEVVRIDPSTNAVDLPPVDLGTAETHPTGVDCGPYNYSDMTGLSLMWTVAPAGVWSAVHDCGAENTVWGTVTWNATLGHENSVMMAQIRAANVETDLGHARYMTVPNGESFECDECDNPWHSCDAVVGRYVQVRVQLNAACHEGVDCEPWPTLQDITLEPSSMPDCNGNGIPDGCFWELLVGTLDCNEDDIPDECQVPPLCYECPDCNENGVPDECDPDCNENDIPDECDIADGTSCDIDTNGIPDECAACCEQGQPCRNTLPTDCGGTYWGGLICEGTGSAGVPTLQCACQGELACCSGADCTERSDCECVDDGGHFIPGLHVCGPATCETGACCTNEVCQAGVSYLACNDPQVYVGGADCSPNPCLGPPGPTIDPPQADGTVLDQGYGTRNRYLSFKPRNAGEETALRVTFADLPSPFVGCIGQTRWVGEPFLVSEKAATTGDSPPNFWAARLYEESDEEENEPYYMNWGSLGTVHVYGQAVVPSKKVGVPPYEVFFWSIYEVQAIDQCWPTELEESYSEPLSIKTSIWGDVVLDCPEAAPCTPPNGEVDFDDISALVDKFRNLANAVQKSRGDIAGDPPVGIPDRLVNFVDISYVGDGFRGLPYLLSGPEGCE